MSAHIARARAITIPANARYDGLITGSAHFVVTTPHGEIMIEAGRMNSLLCRGTPEAIIGFGLMEPEWMPGLPGRNATTQTVYFTDDGPVLPFGKNRTGKRPKGPRIFVRAWGYLQRTVEVQIPISDAQCEAVIALKRDAEAAEDRKAEAVPIRSIPSRPAYRVDGNVFYIQPRAEWVGAR